MAIGRAGPDRIDFLAMLEEETRARLLVNARPIVYRAGSIAFMAGDPPVMALIQSGMMRAFSGARDGRQTSLTYRHEGELLGGVFVANQPLVPDFAVQAVTEVRALKLDLGIVDRLMSSQTDMARALAAELSFRLLRSYRLVAIRTLGSIRERLAFDLLDRACETQLRMGSLVVNATHDELARSIGSAREVITRTLGEMRKAGLIVMSPGKIEASDPVRLSAIVHGVIAQVA